MSDHRELISVREGQEGKAEPVEFPQYGDMSFDDLGSAFMAARYGKPEAYPFDGDGYPGHEMVGKMNFNSLNRIVTWFVKRALASQPDPAAEIARLTQEINTLRRSISFKALEGHVAEIKSLKSELAVIREALSDVVDNPGMYQGAGVDGVIALIEDALANTAHRGQEEKG